jgi:ribonucleoside-diphosphate reductase beta chain
MILPRIDLTLRPCAAVFYEMYKSAIRNTWTVEEVDWPPTSAAPLAAERHLVRLVAFFATGD